MSEAKKILTNKNIRVNCCEKNELLRATISDQRAQGYFSPQNIETEREKDREIRRERGGGGNMKEREWERIKNERE